MKKFELTFTRFKESPSGRGFQTASYDRIEADDLVEIFSKLLIVVAKVTNEILDEKNQEILNANDDIPF